MRQTSEYCTVGHPDRTCDFIASTILDRYLELDPRARVALEVQLKDQFCTVSGEVTTTQPFSEELLKGFVRDAIKKIGYTKEYQDQFGEQHCIASDDVEITLHIGQQSGDIAQGVDTDGWGDQGIFWGMAVNDPKRGNMPKDYYLAREIAKELQNGGYGGLDIKTQVTVEDGIATECIIAIPIPPDQEEFVKAAIRQYVRNLLGEGCNIVINGTGRYVTHGSVGDCGTTGRKLVADFYGGNCRIGGGSPWGKDPTKADVTLNVYARRLALDYMREHGLDTVYCSISCCIGKREIAIAFYDAENNLLETRTDDAPASHLIGYLMLREPNYAERCANGLFGYED